MDDLEPGPVTLPDPARGLRDFSSPDIDVLLVPGDEFAEKKPDNSED